MKVFRILWVGLAGATGVAGAFGACGGTTGRADLAATATDATVLEAAAGPDAAVDGSDANPADFDADIQYADENRLRGFVAATDAANADASTPGSDWPICASDTLSRNDAGHLKEFPDNSGVCSTYEWTPTFRQAGSDAGSSKGCGPGHFCQTCDECIRFGHSGINALGNIFPPCAELREAGVAAQGAAAGTPLFQLCAALFDCVSKSGCVTGEGGVFDPGATPAKCYCGTTNPADCQMPDAANGVCRHQIEEAFQAGPSTSAADIVTNLTDISGKGLPGAPTGAQVMEVYNGALTAGCDLCFPIPTPAH